MLSYFKNIIVISIIFAFMVLSCNVGVNSYFPKSQKNVVITSDTQLKLFAKRDAYKLTDISKAAIDLADTSNVSSYLVLNYKTGEILSQKAMQEKVSIASLTKIMTAMITLDLANPDELFEVSSTASKVIPTKIGVAPHEKITVNELLHALLMTSANDAAEVLREGVDKKYGKEIFIAAMNEKAAFVGLKNTHFANPQGFDDEKNFSTSYDLALLSHYMLQNYPLLSEIVKKDFVTLAKNENHKRFDLYNWNGLLGVYPGVVGIKIGNTTDAGLTTIVLSERGDNAILVILLHAPHLLERDLWASNLLDFGFKALGETPQRIASYQLRAKYASWQ